MLDLSWQSRAAAIYFAFKQISQSLPSILFLEENYKGSRPNSDESTRLSCLGWSIICRMDYFFMIFFKFLLLLFYGLLGRRHCSFPLSNSDSKFLSDLFITASDVDYVHISMFDISYWSSETLCFMIENRQMFVWKIQYIIIFLLYH